MCFWCGLEQHVATPSLLVVALMLLSYLQRRHDIDLRWFGT